MWFGKKRYRCRECGLAIPPGIPTSTCPSCGSIYLIPLDSPAGRRLGKIQVTVAQRFLSLVLGVLFGLLTFFVWGVVVLVRGAPVIAEISAPVWHVGLMLAIAVSLVIGLVGFIWGDKKVARALSILWGTDEEFNATVHLIDLQLPRWLGYLLLVVVIAGIYGYLFAIL